MTAQRRARGLAATALFAGALLFTTGCADASAPAPSASAEASAPAPTPTPEASESAPVRAIDHAAGELDEPVDVSVDGGDAGVSVTFREITIEPGASTGVHCHHGQLIAVVQAGALTHYSETHPGGVRVYEVGDAIIEGAGYPHEGRNEGADDVVLWVTYVIPEGQPLAETDLAECD